jgi:hypothetical protein
MTRYSVEWGPQLEADLTSNWRATSETRAFLTQVANWVDKELAIDAHVKGAASAEGERTFVAFLPGGQISVDFAVSEQDASSSCED